MVSIRTFRHSLPTSNDAVILLPFKNCTLNPQCSSAIATVLLRWLDDHEGTVRCASICDDGARSLRVEHFHQLLLLQHSSIILELVGVTEEKP